MNRDREVYCDRMGDRSLLLRKILPVRVVQDRDYIDVGRKKNEIVDEVIC